MRYCTNCGAANQDGTSFCTSCGQKLDAQIPVTPSSRLPQESARMPVEAANFPGNAVPVAAGASVTSQAKKPGINPKIFIIGGCVLAALIVIIAAVLLLGGNRASYAVGDTVEFGTYEQDGNTSNGAEAIEWRVLAVQDGKALLISRNVLDCVKYEANKVSTTWESSYLRTWMNNNFYDAAFTTDEKNKVSSVLNANDGQSSTTDKVFALSANEAAQYLPTKSDLCAAATTYAKNNGCYVGSYDNSRWWLRTQGASNTKATFVYSHGVIETSGQDVNETEYATGARPAIWVNI